MSPTNQLQDMEDLVDYRGEICDIVNSELNKLKRFEKEIDKCSAISKSALDKRILGWARQDVGEAKYTYPDTLGKD